MGNTPSDEQTMDNTPSDEQTMDDDIDNTSPPPAWRLPYNQLYGEWTGKGCERYVPVFKNTLMVTEELISLKFATKLILTNQSDVETMHLDQPAEGKRLPEFPELLGIWKQKEMSGVLQIEYDYKFDDVQPYEGYASLRAGGETAEELKNIGMRGVFHVTVALYNHALNLLTYIDSEAANLEDDNYMPPHIAKKINVVRKTEAFLRKSAESNGIDFEGSRDMFGWKCDNFYFKELARTIGEENMSLLKASDWGEDWGSQQCTDDIMEIEQGDRDDLAQLSDDTFNQILQFVQDWKSDYQSNPTESECNYERTPPQNMEHEQQKNDSPTREEKRKYLRSWGTDEKGVVDSGTCIAWSLLIADEMNEKGITGQQWSEEFHSQHKTAEDAQMYISHAITRDMVRCQRATMKSVKGGGEQVSNRDVADFLKDRVLQHEATAGRDVALRRNVNRLLQYSNQ